MAYTKVNWEDLPSTNTPLNATNLNKMDTQIKQNETDISGLDTRLTTAEGDIDTLETAVATKPLVGNYVISANNTLSCNSTYSNLGGSKTFEVKNGNTVIIMARVGGLYISNTGYSIVVDAYVDDNTASSSGAANIYPSWSTPAMSSSNDKVSTTLCFCFTGLSTGNHTFQLKWRTNNAAATGYMGQYGGAQIVLFEV